MQGCWRQAHESKECSYGGPYGSVADVDLYGGFAQAGDEKPAPTLAGSRPRMEPQMPASPCYYCVERDAPALWNWQVHNRLSDLNAITRSEYLNPESDLDYMLRRY